MFRLLHLPFVAYKLVMMWRITRACKWTPSARAKHENSHRFAAAKVN